MKKKHRDITVGGVTYGWIAKPHKIGLITEVSIYKDKKVWITANTVGIVTPSFVSAAITKELTKDAPAPVVKKKAAKKAAKKVAKKAPKKKAKNDTSTEWQTFTDLL